MIFADSRLGFSGLGSQTAKQSPPTPSEYLREDRAPTAVGRSSVLSHSCDIRCHLGGSVAFVLLTPCEVRPSHVHLFPAPSLTIISSGGQGLPSCPIRPMAQAWHSAWQFVGAQCMLAKHPSCFCPPLVLSSAPAAPRPRRFPLCAAEAGGLLLRAGNQLFRISRRTGWRRGLCPGCYDHLVKEERVGREPEAVGAPEIHSLNGDDGIFFRSWAEEDPLHLAAHSALSFHVWAADGEEVSVDPEQGCSSSPESLHQSQRRGSSERVDLRSWRG